MQCSRRLRPASCRKLVPARHGIGRLSDIREGPLEEWRGVEQGGEDYLRMVQLMTTHSRHTILSRDTVGVPNPDVRYLPFEINCARSC